MNDSPTSWPLVSIGVAVYNGEKYLRGALDSVVAQDYPHLEIIISDNASTDATEAICREYATRDARISYHRHAENRGAPWNFMHAFELSHGKYFMWAAYDDWRAPDYISTCVPELEAHPEAVVCHTHIAHVDETGAVDHVDYDDLSLLSHSPVRRLRKFLRPNTMIYAIYGLIRADALRRVAPMGSYYAADRAFITELSLQGPIRQVRRTLFFYRMTPTAESPEEYFKRNMATMAPGYQHRKWQLLRWNLGREHVRAILRTDFSPFTKVLLLLQLSVLFTIHRDTLHESIRLGQELLGPTRYEQIARWIRPLVGIINKLRHR